MVQLHSLFSTQFAIWLEWYISSSWGVRLPRHIWDVENSQVRILPTRQTKKETRCFKVSRIKEPGGWLLTPKLKQVSGGNVTTRRVVLRRWENSQPYIAEGNPNEKWWVKCKLSLTFLNVKYAVIVLIGRTSIFQVEGVESYSTYCSNLKSFLFMFCKCF